MAKEHWDQWEQDFCAECDTFWDSLPDEEQFLAFCAVVQRLHRGMLMENRSYRGVLYDTFGFGLQSYVYAQVSGFLDLHNALHAESK